MPLFSRLFGKRRARRARKSRVVDRSYEMPIGPGSDIRLVFGKPLYARIVTSPPATGPAMGKEISLLRRVAPWLLAAGGIAGGIYLGKKWIDWKREQERNLPYYALGKLAEYDPIGFVLSNVVRGRFI